MCHRKSRCALKGGKNICFLAIIFFNENKWRKTHKTVSTSVSSLFTPPKQFSQKLKQLFNLLESSTK